MLENRDKLFRITLFAALTALCYVGTFVMIPLPTGGKIHLGNLICILASLILGGVQGGLVGSLGMGLNDLHFYLDTPSTIIRTLILKFLMGLICGSLFNLLRRKNVRSQSCSIFLFVLSLLSLGIGIFSLYVYLNNGIMVQDKVIEFNMLVPICLFIFAFLFALYGFLFWRKRQLFGYLLVAISLATIVNILGEFILRAFFSLTIDRMGLAASLALSLSKIPASILTGVLTCVLAIAIYPSLEVALDAKVKKS